MEGGVSGNSGGGGGGGVVDSEMSPSSGSGGSGVYHPSPASFNSPQSVHSSISHHPTPSSLSHPRSRHTPSSLSHTSSTGQHIDAPPLMGSSIGISLADYPFGGTPHGEMGSAPIDVHAFGASPSGMGGFGSVPMAPAGLVSSSGLVSAGAGGELGEGSTGVMGGGGLTMEDVLSSVFWDSMVVPG
jgi:hypothetical protein